MTNHTRWQDAELARLSEILEGDAGVVAMAVLGSVGKDSPGLVDWWSDIDVSLVVADAALSRFYPDTGWLASLGNVWATERHASDDYVVTRACFDSCWRFDFCIATESTAREIARLRTRPHWTGDRVLFSRSSAADAMFELPVTDPPAPAIDEERLVAMTNEFSFKSALAVHKIVRGDLLIALHLALDLVRDCAVLDMAYRDRITGTTIHRTPAIGEEASSQLAAGLQPDTAAGLLDMVASCAARFGELAGRLAGRNVFDSRPLLTWIEHGRRAVEEGDVRKYTGSDTMNTSFRSATEIMLAVTEEVGEVATEVALLEHVGSKATWDKAPSIGRLANEITHVLNLLAALREHYSIDPETASDSTEPSTNV